MRRQLGQLRNAGTGINVLFSPSINAPYTIDLILCVNHSGAATDITIYHDADGTDTGTTASIFGPYSMVAGETFEFSPDGGISDYQSAGQVAVKASVADSVTFTAYGEIQGEEI